MAASRESRGSKFALELDGANAGLLESVDGGDLFAEVTTVTSGTDKLPRKQIGPARYEDFSLGIGLNMTAAVYDWIAQSWATGGRKNGSLVEIDFDSQLKSQREFSKALITEVTIPALEGSSKDPGAFTVKVASQSIRTSKLSGKFVGGGGKQKKFLRSNFTLEIDGLPCTRVSKIESFTVKRNVTTVAGGPGRLPIDQGKVEFPNLVISISAADEQSWIDWADDFIVKGNNSNDKEKNGTISLMTPNMKDVLAQISLFNLGICRLSLPNAVGDAIARFTAELYCERMELKVN